MKVTNFYYLFFLVFVSVLFCAFVSVAADALAIVIVFFKIGRVISSWHELLSNMIARSPVPGVILGIGLWLKLIFFDNRGRNKLPPSDSER